MKIQQIIFDLDGTLIDSSASILASFSASFRALGRKPVRPLTSDIIGPPLKETLTVLSGTNDPVLLDELVAAFKSYYDTEGYRQTAVFPGVAEMLSELSGRALPIYIATNKRIVPTILVIEHLGWFGYFTEICALDSVSPPLIDKSELLVSILEKHSLIDGCTLYIGDRLDDEVMAGVAKIPFAYAGWGYGMADCPSGFHGKRVLSSPGDVVSYSLSCF